MITVHLIRHGQKESGRPDPGLTDTGHDQAAKTAVFLRQFPITRIIASPALRTRQTAAHIAAGIGISVETDTRLAERMDFDCGLYPDRDTFFREWTRVTWDRSIAPAGGTSSRDTGDRIHRVVADIHADDPLHIVLVTHGGAIADFLRNVLPETHVAGLVHEFPEGRDFLVAECSITSVTMENGVYALARLHYVDHL